MFAILVVNLAWQPGSAWYLVTIVAHIAAPDIFRQRDRSHIAAIKEPTVRHSERHCSSADARDDGGRGGP
jgi:hypothetical protein